MSTAFISYRRADDPFAVAEIERSLAAALGKDQVFRDVSDIAAADDFRKAMTDALERHSIVVVVIGRNWNPQRLFDPDDNVRFEIETAFRLGKRVVPVLVGDARWPEADDLPPPLRPLATLSYLPLRGGLDLERDTDAILSATISTRPLHLSGEVKRLLLFGTCAVRVDGVDAGRGPIRKGVAFGPLTIRPGDHVVEATCGFGGITRRGEYAFSARQPGSWRLEIEYLRGPATFTFALIEPTA